MEISAFLLSLEIVCYPLIVSSCSEIIIGCFILRMQLVEMVSMSLLLYNFPQHKFEIWQDDLYAIGTNCIIGNNSYTMWFYETLSWTRST